MIQIGVWLLVGALVGAALSWLVARRVGASDPADVSVALPVRAEHSSGAAVPWSTRSSQATEILRTLLPAERTADSVLFGDPDPGGQGFLLEIMSSVRDAGSLSSAADLPTITGPLARAVQALAGSERLMSELMRRGGYAVVAVPPGTKWMTAHGHKVAQALGEGGKAGARARVVGLAGLGAVAPELLGLSAALAAEYVLVAKIEQAGRVATLGHQRQVSEALAAGTVGRALVEQTRDWSEDPRDWPELLVRELVDCHAQLKLQAAASSRMRDLVLAVPDSAGDDDGPRPAKPGSGDPAQAGAELSAGYEVHASAAQVAAVRLEHALAHGDEATASVLLLDLARHLDDLREHHRILGDVRDQRSRWFQRTWGSVIESIANGYAPLVERMGSGGQFMLTLRNDGAPELRALPPGVLELPAPQDSVDQSVSEA